MRSLRRAPIDAGSRRIQPAPGIWKPRGARTSWRARDGHARRSKQATALPPSSTRWRRAAAGAGRCSTSSCPTETGCMRTSLDRNL